MSWIWIVTLSKLKIMLMSILCSSVSNPESCMHVYFAVWLCMRLTSFFAQTVSISSINTAAPLREWTAGMFATSRGAHRTCEKSKPSPWTHKMMTSCISVYVLVTITKPITYPPNQRCGLSSDISVLPTIINPLPLQIFFSIMLSK